MYKNSRGETFNIFDEGLEFYYTDGVDSYLSPDRSYFFVNFSVTGLSEGGSSPPVEANEYLCAFVRMSDGCVVRVDTGGICGGKWAASNRWVGVDPGKLDFEPPTARKAYENYSSGVGDSSVTPTDITQYLLQGTTVDNLLTCDPVSKKNESYYRGLLKVLARGKNRGGTDKIIKALKTLPSDYFR